MAGSSNVGVAAERAICNALRKNDALGLLAILTSIKTGDILMDGYITHVAAVCGGTQCLHVLKEWGWKLDTATWEQAAVSGHVNCLAYAVTHGYTLEDSVLWYAVKYGHLACVEFLLQHGLPRGPHKHSFGHVTPDQMECYQLLARKNVQIHPASSIVAAFSCDVDFLRWLHKYGVPLWQHAREQDKSFDRMCPIHWSVNHNTNPPSTFAMPDDPTSLNRMWKALRYASLHGAPVTPRARALLGEKWERSQAVLRCFKAAVRLSQGPVDLKQGRVWANMAALPSDIIEGFLTWADLEIKESFMRRP